jgi:protein SCO1/2
MSEDQQDPKPAQAGTLTLRQRLIAMSLATVAGIGMSFVVWQFIGDKTPDEIVVQQTGIAAVGGPFALINHDGNPVTQEDFAGQYMLIYFGYTWCPDVCPLALQFMSNALSRLGPEASQIQPLLITIDPERDTPEVMRQYITSFQHGIAGQPELVGLTGSLENIEAVAAAYKMYFRKTEPLDAENPMSYGLDHMNIFYFMGPDGAYVAHFMSPTSPKDVAEVIASHLQ